MALRMVSLPVLLVLAISTPAFSESYDEHLTVDKSHLKVVNLIGEVHVTKQEGSTFEVVVHVQGKDANRDRIYVRLEGETLTVHFPLAEGTHFVYPNLAMGSRSTFYWNPEGGAIHYGVKDVLGIGDHRKITVTHSGSAPEMWADVEIRVPAKGRLEVVDGVGTLDAEAVEGDLTLRVHSGPIRAEKIVGELNVDTGSGSVSVASVKGRVIADTGSGRVTVESVDGDLDVDTGSGSVSVTGAHGTKIHADTGSGSVHLADIACDVLKVDTGSGGIDVQNATIGSGHFDTGSGGVELALDELHGGPIHVDTGSGSVVLDLPPNPSATVSASTGSGGIQVDLEDVSWMKTARTEKSFQVGKGEARVSLETGSGSIRVKS
ncbi:MAG TPA: DUF4097 family beta strand repeat-containing protein [Dongiaceae bacterium]|nr:DUF4097 family beta strand repeat-containing protein [Dongiaceae bacterium]